MWRKRQSYVNPRIRSEVAIQVEKDSPRAHVLCLSHQVRDCGVGKPDQGWKTHIKTSRVPPLLGQR